MTIEQRWKRIVSAVVLANLSGLSHASDLTLYGQVEGWHIYSDKSSCAIIDTFRNGIELSVDLDHRLNEVSLAFSDPSVKSLAADSVRELLIAFSGGRGKTIDTDWGKTEFTVSVDDKGVRSFSTLLTEEFITDFSRYDKVGFFYKDVLLQAFDLSGSAAAAQMLRACAAKASRQNPSDPFADEPKK